MSNSAFASVDKPGTFIQEELDERGWTQSDLAYILGMQVPQLNAILSGKVSISPDMAVILGEAFDMPAEFFANLQKLYDLSLVKTPDPGVRRRATWQSAYPVREMIKRQWIDESDPGLLDLQMLRFFKKTRIEEVPAMGADAQAFAFAAKKSSYDNTTPIQWAWMYRVRQIAEMIEAPLYSKQRLEKNLATIRSSMLDPDDIGAIPQILLECGVRFVLVEALQGSKIDGVCLWLDRQPVIGMTLRLDRMDNFCFVLRHEIEHVLCEHGIEEQFAPVDEFDAEGAGLESENQEEAVATSASLDFCVPQSLLDSFLARKGEFVSEQDVLGFAARVEINPAIVIGQIQHRRHKWGWLRKYLVGVRNHLMGWKFKDGWGEPAAVTL